MRVGASYIWLIMMLYDTIIYNHDTVSYSIIDYHSVSWLKFTRNSKKLIMILYDNPMITIMILVSWNFLLLSWYFLSLSWFLPVQWKYHDKIKTYHDKLRKYHLKVKFLLSFKLIFWHQCKFKYQVKLKHETPNNNTILYQKSSTNKNCLSHCTKIESSIWIKSQIHNWKKK